MTAEPLDPAAEARNSYYSDETVFRFSRGGDSRLEVEKWTAKRFGNDRVSLSLSSYDAPDLGVLLPPDVARALGEWLLGGESA